MKSKFPSQMNSWRWKSGIIAKPMEGNIPVATVSQTNLSRFRVCLLQMAALGLVMTAGVASAAYFTNDTNWAGADWTLANGDIISGIHTNVGQFLIPG